MDKLLIEAPIPSIVSQTIYEIEKKTKILRVTKNAIDQYTDLSLNPISPLIMKRNKNQFFY